MLLVGVVHSAEFTVLEVGSAAQLTALGNEALMQRRYETAIEHYRRALTVDKTSFQATFNLALSYQSLDKDIEARRWYDAALKISPDHPEVLCNLGYLSFRADAWQTAEDYFLEAARQAAGSSLAADYWFNVGTAREKREQWLAARRAYDECISLNKDHFGGHFNIGTLYLGALSNQPKALEKAEEALTKARDLAPNRAEAWVNLGLCLERQGKKEAAEALTKATDVASPTYKPHALWNRALFYDRQRPPQRLAMRDDLQALLAIDPQYPGANGLLGAYHFAIGEFDQAASLLNREVVGDQFDGRNIIDVEAHYLLAMLYTDHRPNASKALNHAAAYYQLRPDSAKIQELRRRALRLSGSVTGSAVNGTTSSQTFEPATNHTIDHQQPSKKDTHKTTAPTTPSEELLFPPKAVVPPATKSPSEH
jgi:tetratricopeptide (TPR) repeat protein